MSIQSGQSASSQSVIPLLIDCDTGRDDALSLWLSLQLGQNLVAVTTSYGNTTLENVTANTAGVLSYVGRDDLPLWRGAEGPRRDHAGFRQVVIPRQQSAGNGLCNITLPTTRLAEFILPIRPVESYVARIKSIVAAHGKLDYVVLGPATNFAQLCDALGSNLPDYIRSVTMLGGKLGPLWDASPVADFNIICDPYAVDRLLSAPIIKRFVTLDTTWDISMSLDSVRTLTPMSPVGLKAKEIMIAYCERFSPDRIFRFHDPSVFLLYHKAEPFVSRNLRVHLEEQSPEFGRLLVVDAQEQQGQMVEICDWTAVDRQEMLKVMLENLGLAA